MASCFFLLKQFEDVLVYLKSIKTYLASDDDFNWNYGIACASNGEWAEAEEAFGAIQGEAYRQEGPFLNWSARTSIMQGDHSMRLRSLPNFMISFVCLFITHRDCPHCVRSCQGIGHKPRYVLCNNRIHGKHGHQGGLDLCEAAEAYIQWRHFRSK